MEDLLSYELRDFLMFSASSYHRLIELYVQDLSYLVLAPSIAVLVAAYVFWRQGTVKPLILVLGFMFLLVVWQFFYVRFQEIMWGAVYFAAAFGLQGVALIWAAQMEVTNEADRTSPLIIICAAVSVLALLYPVFGVTGVGAVEITGITPDPTVLLSLAVIVATNVSRWFLVIPITWALFSGLMLYALEEPHYWLLPALVIVTVGIATLLKQRQLAD